MLEKSLSKEVDFWNVKHQIELTAKKLHKKENMITRKLKEIGILHNNKAGY
jgi:hypothetical protein